MFEDAVQNKTGITGANPGFLNRGRAKDYGAHQDHETRSPLYRQLGFRVLEILGF